MEKIFAQHGDNGRKDHTPKTEQSPARIACKQGEQGVESKTVPHQPRLEDLSQKQAGGVEDEQADPMIKVALQAEHERPREENGANSEHGKQIDQCHKEGEQKGILNAEDRKAEEELGKGEEGQKQIRAQIAP